LGGLAIFRGQLLDALLQGLHRRLQGGDAGVFVGLIELSLEASDGLFQGPNPCLGGGVGRNRRRSRGWNRRLCLLRLRREGRSDTASRRWLRAIHGWGGLGSAVLRARPKSRRQGGQDE
jgi:hypothetical protein